MANYMIIKQRIIDLAQFQAAFDEMKPMRESLKDLGEFRAAEESDIVIVMLKVTDVARAKEYWHSILLSEGRVKAGAVGLVPVGTAMQAGSINQVWLTNGLVRDAVAGGYGAERSCETSHLRLQCHGSSELARFLLVTRQVVNWMNSLGFSLIGHYAYAMLHLPHESACTCQTSQGISPGGQSS
jgi:hypothetical protein